MLKYDVPSEEALLLLSAKEQLFVDDMNTVISILERNKMRADKYIGAINRTLRIARWRARTNAFAMMPHEEYYSTWGIYLSAMHLVFGLDDMPERVPLPDRFDDIASAYYDWFATVWLQWRAYPGKGWDAALFGHRDDRFHDTSPFMLMRWKTVGLDVPADSADIRNYLDSYKKAYARR